MRRNIAGEIQKIHHRRASRSGKNRGQNAKRIDLWLDSFAIQGTSDEQMPELARFFGIIICMYVEIGAPHHQPHFHAYFQNKSAVFAIDNIEMIAGLLDRKQQRLVEAWAEMHQEELMENWHRLQSGELPLKVAPLR